jgi:predicted nucleic acid-binding protein
MGSTPLNIAVALENVKVLAIDTAPFIYFVENSPDYAEKMGAVFRAIQATDIEIVSSVITLAEVLTKPLKTGDKELEKQYRTLFEESRNLRLAQINVATAYRAAQLRAQYNLRTPDAFQIAVAIETGCNAFLTNDLGLKRVTGIQVLVLDELELETPDN